MNLEVDKNSSLSVLWRSVITQYTRMSYEHELLMLSTATLLLARERELEL
jgi:hypothetical protein